MSLAEHCLPRSLPTHQHPVYVHLVHLAQLGYPCCFMCTDTANGVISIQRGRRSKVISIQRGRRIGGGRGRERGEKINPESKNSQESAHLPQCFLDAVTEEAGCVSAMGKETTANCNFTWRKDIFRLSHTRDQLLRAHC